MTNTLPRAENPTRHLTLQYLLLAFSQLHVRHEALSCLDDLLTFLAAAPHEPMPDGRTRGELAAEYLDGLSRDGRCRDCDFEWLLGDAEYQDTLHRHRALLAGAGIGSVPGSGRPPVAAPGPWSPHPAAGYSGGPWMTCFGWMRRRRRNWCATGRLRRLSWSTQQ